MFRTAIHQTLAVLLEAEIQQLVGASSGARTKGRRDVRNGSHPRQLLTSEGPIELVVPRTREHGAATATLGRETLLGTAVDSRHGQRSRTCGNVESSATM